MDSAGGRALEGLGSLPDTEPYQTPNAGNLMCRSETTRDKLRGQKGNSPDHRLRPPNTA